MINSKVSNSILHANIRIYASPAKNPLWNGHFRASYHLPGLLSYLVCLPLVAGDLNADQNHQIQYWMPREVWIPDKQRTFLV